MKYEDFTRQVYKAGLTLGTFATLIGRAPNSITNYSSSGSVPTHLAVIATLMAEMKEAGLNFEACLKKLKREPKKKAKEAIDDQASLIALFEKSPIAHQDGVTPD